MHALRSLVMLLVLVATLMAETASAWAQPWNDDFYSRDYVFFEDTVTGTTAGATRQLDEPFHWWIGEGGSVWFEWYTFLDGCYTIDTCGSSFDTVLAVYKAPPPASPNIALLTLVASNDDSPACSSSSRQSSVSFQADDVELYYIAVAGFGKGDAGNYTLSVKRCTPPPNDDYADAQPIAVYEEVSATTVGATREYYEYFYPSTPSSSGSVWFRPIASVDDCLTIYSESLGQRVRPFVFWRDGLYEPQLLSPVSSGFTYFTNGSNTLYRDWNTFRYSNGYDYRFACVGLSGGNPFRVSLVGCEPYTLPSSRGDADGDGRVNIADVTAIFNYLEQGTQSIPGNADANCDGKVDATDALFILHYLRDREEFLYYNGPYDCGGAAYFAGLLNPAKKYESELLSRYEVAYLGTREWSRRLASDPVVVAESIPEYVPLGLYYLGGIQLTTRASIFAAWAAMAAFWLALGGLVAWQFRRDWSARVRG